MLSLIAAASLAAAALPAADPLLKPVAPDYAERWLQPQTPLKLYGDTYFVGFKGLSLALIATPAGLILIDGALPQAVPAVEANIRKLGFDIRQVKYILNTESHYDHASGIAALARDSGAVVLTSPRGATALRAGRWDVADPQAKDLEAFPPVAAARPIGDGQSIRLGGVIVTAHHTPGHTPGSTSWSWKSCEKERCLNMVFSSSFSPVASDDFHFTGDRGHDDVTPSYRASIRKLGALPCDVLISAHPEQSGLDAKLSRAEARRSTAPFVDSGACRAYSAKYEALLDERIAREKAR
jgi:metallo-beta-lactamase class B